MAVKQEVKVKDIKGGELLKFYLSLLYFNPQKSKGKEWIPLPKGLKIKMWDHDSLSLDDFKVEAETTGENPIYLEMKKEEENPEIYFVIETGKKYINLESNKLVDRINNPSKFPFIALPEKIDSRKKKDEAGKDGYLKGYKGKGEGTKEKPWTFKLEDIRAYIQLKYYQDSSDKFIPLPKGLVVSAFDYDWFSKDDFQAVGCVWDEGKVYLPIFVKDESKPDVFFSIDTNGKSIYLDKKDSKYVDRIDPEEEEKFVELPDYWQSKDVHDASGKWGIRENFDKEDIESWSSPWKFHYIGGISEAKWEKRNVVAYDESNKKNMSVKIQVKTKSIEDETEANVEVYQFKKNAEPTLYKEVKDLKIKKNQLVGDDEKPPEFNFEWHNTIYNYKRTQYFFKIRVGPLVKAIEQKKDKMIRLKQFDGVVTNPDGSLSGAAKEGKWINNYFKQKGPWIEATEDKLKKDGHEVMRYQGKSSNVSVDKFRELLERNKFLHHQASHGDAYCYGHVSKVDIEKSGAKGADGVKEWWCPQCENLDDVTGVICLKDDDFEKDDVEDLDRSPKVLVLANCCLTAITDEFPDAWIDKGTRWYIGWAVPVGDSAALKFAKAFYKRWFEQYKLDPDKVNEAFDDIEGTYSDYRPRIFGM